MPGWSIRHFRWVLHGLEEQKHRFSWTFLQGLAWHGEPWVSTQLLIPLHWGSWALPGKSAENHTHSQDPDPQLIGTCLRLPHPSLYRSYGWTFRHTPEGPTSRISLHAAVLAVSFPWWKIRSGLSLRTAHRFQEQRISGGPPAPAASLDRKVAEIEPRGENLWHAGEAWNQDSLASSRAAGSRKWSVGRGGVSSAAQSPRVLWDRPGPLVQLARLQPGLLLAVSLGISLLFRWAAFAQLGGKMSPVLPPSRLGNNKNPPISGLRGWRLLFSQASGATCPVQEARKLPPAFLSPLPLSLLILSLPLSLSPFPTLSFSLSYACAHTYTHTLTHAWTHQHSSHTPGKMPCTRRKSALAPQNQRISSLDRLAYR